VGPIHQLQSLAPGQRVGSSSASSNLTLQSCVPHALNIDVEYAKAWGGIPCLQRDKPRSMRRCEGSPLFVRAPVLIAEEVVLPAWGHTYYSGGGATKSLMSVLAVS